MKVPLSWLKDFVDVDLPVEQLAERMTLAGLEVESITRIGELWDRDKIFVGQILDVVRHPDAERLTLVRVDYGAKEPMTVVTGAPNMMPYIGQDLSGGKGPKVAYAMSGSRLVDGHSDERRIVKLKPSKIRGVVSEGMVCSEKELDLSDSHEGNLVLPDDAPVGMPLVDYMGDVVLDYDVKGAFGHLQCIYGAAREVAALTDKPLRPEVMTILEREPVTITPRRGFHGHRDRRARPVPALLGRVDRGRHDRAIADVDAAAAAAGGDAADQQRRRHHELRHARAGPAAARVRLRPAQAAGE